jgi:hypothetical protein
VFEVGGIASEEGEVVRECDRRDHRVERTGSGLSSSTMQRTRYATESAGGGCVKGEWLEVGLDLLETELPFAPSPGSDVTSGPTDSSASVTAVITGSLGRCERSANRSRRTTALVSRMPCRTDSLGITTAGR